MPTPAQPRALTVGFVLMPDFTMLALAAFLDTLRLAADEGDRSRPIACAWTLMTEDGRSVRASNGVRVQPDGGLADPSAFDYLAVVGGTLHNEARAGSRLDAYLRDAARNVPIAGLCTGSFVLARAGLMNGRRSCVSWFHLREFQAEFPKLDAVADQLFVIDGDRITCAGGTGVIHLASHLVERHLGRGRAAKGLRVMLEERARPATAPQPLPDLIELDDVADPRVRRAVLMIERRLEHPQPIDEIAGALGVSTRQLTRLVKAQTGHTPEGLREELRLRRARDLLRGGDVAITEIALRFGFADGPHFARRYRKRFAETPSTTRDRGRLTQ